MFGETGSRACIPHMPGFTFLRLVLSITQEMVRATFAVQHETEQLKINKTSKQKLLLYYAPCE